MGDTAELTALMNAKALGGVDLLTQQISLIEDHMKLHSGEEE